MYNRAKNEFEEISSTQLAEGNEQATQTTPNPCPPEPHCKRGRESADESPKIQVVKRSKITESKKEQHANEEGKKEEHSDGKNVRETRKRNGNSRKKRQKRERNDAMIISAKGETTYADILRQIKGDKSLRDLGDSVSRIRRTQKGELLLEIKPKDKGSVDLFRSQIEKSIGNKAGIKTRRQELIIECKDMDEITTKEDICNAFRTQLEVSEMTVEDIKTLRRS